MPPKKKIQFLKPLFINLVCIQTKMNKELILNITLSQ